MVIRMKELLHFSSLPLQLSDFLFQLCDQPGCPQLCCCLLPLDRSHRLGLALLDVLNQSGEDLPTLLNVFL